MSKTEEKITVLLADDHPLTRDGIRKTLEQAADICVIGEARDGIETEKLVSQLRPKVLVLDLIMPGPRPLEIEKGDADHDGLADSQAQAWSYQLELQYDLPNFPRECAIILLF